MKQCITNRIYHIKFEIKYIRVEMGGRAGFGSLPVSSFAPRKSAAFQALPLINQATRDHTPKNGYVRKVVAGELTKVGVHLLLAKARCLGSSFLLVLVVAKVFNL